MIKGVTFMRPASTPAVLDKMASFFSVLGFEPGKGWEDGSSRAAPFLAPLGNLEFVTGTLPGMAEVLVEVTSLDSVHEVAKSWLAKNEGETEVSNRITDITETHWKSRSFTVEPVAGIPFLFWEWEDVLKGKPLAVEYVSDFVEEAKVSGLVRKAFDFMGLTTSQVAPLRAG